MTVPELEERVSRQLEKGVNQRQKGGAGQRADCHLSASNTLCSATRGNRHSLSCCAGSDIFTYLAKAAFAAVQRCDAPAHALTPLRPCRLGYGDGGACMEAPEVVPG